LRAMMSQQQPSRFEEKSVQLLDRMTSIMVRAANNPADSKTEGDYSTTCFDAAMMLREMLQCWKSKAFHQCCRNSLLVRLARVRATLKTSMTQKILQQELKMKTTKGKWKHVVLSLEPGRIIMKDSHGSGQELLGIDKILSVNLNNAECRAEFEICYGAESYLFRVAHIVQRCLWMHAILRERQICRIDSFVNEQSLEFREALLKAITETEEPVKIDVEQLQFLYAEYSEIMESEFAEKLKMEGVFGAVLEGKGCDGTDAALEFQRIGIQATKWDVEFELGRAKRMVVTQHEPGGMQFAFGSDEMIGLQYVDEKKECIVRIRIRDRKTTIAVDFADEESYRKFHLAMNWFTYDRPLRQFYHRRLLTHLLSIKFINSSSLRNRDSVHWLIEIIYKSSILAANTPSSMVAPRQQHHLIQLLYDISSRLDFTEADERRRYQSLVSILSTGTVEAESVADLDITQKLPKRPTSKDFNCPNGHCVILLAKTIEQVNGLEMMEAALNRHKIETSLWVLKTMFHLTNLRNSYHLCTTPTSRRQSSVMLEFRNGAHPFQYYVDLMPHKHSQRVLAVVYNMILGRSSTETHKKITEAIAPEIKRPELIPFLFRLIEGKMSSQKTVLEKFASMMVGKVENSTMLTRFPGCQSWFFPFLLQQTKGEDADKRRHIIKLAVVNIASIIAYDVMGNPVRDVFEMEAWKCIRLLLRFTKWNERGRNVLKMLLGSAGLIIANKVKDYMKKYEADAPQMWKKLARFYFVYCELLLNMPARYALELGEFKVAVDKKGRSLDRNCLVRVIDIGFKIKAAMAMGMGAEGGGNKVRNRIRFSTMVSFLHDVRQTMEKRVHIPGDRVALFNRAIHKLNRASVTMSSILTSSVKCAHCNVPDLLFEYSKSYFENKSAAAQPRARRTADHHAEAEDEEGSSSDDNEPPPPPPPRSPQISIHAASAGDMHDWERAESAQSGVSVMSNESSTDGMEGKYLKPDAGHKKSVSLDCGKREVTEKTAQMFQNIIASLRQKAESLSAKERKSQQDLSELKAELRAMREHERNRRETIKNEIQSPTPPPPPGMQQVVEACLSGSLRTIHRALKAGGLHEADEAGKTMLHHSVYGFNPSAVRAIIEAKGDVNRTDAKGRTALHYALEVGGGESGRQIVQLLLDSRADVDIADCNGLAALNVVSTTERCLSAMLSRHSSRGPSSAPSSSAGPSQSHLPVPDSARGDSSSDAKGTGVFGDDFWGKKSSSDLQQSASTIAPVGASSSSSSPSALKQQQSSLATTEHKGRGGGGGEGGGEGNVFDGGFWSSTTTAGGRPTTPPIASSRSMDSLSATQPLPSVPAGDGSSSSGRGEGAGKEQKKKQQQHGEGLEGEAGQLPKIKEEQANSVASLQQKSTGVTAVNASSTTASSANDLNDTSGQQKTEGGGGGVVLSSSMTATSRADTKHSSSSAYSSSSAGSGTDNKKTQQQSTATTTTTTTSTTTTAAATGGQGVVVNDGAAPVPEYRCTDDLHMQCKDLLGVIGRSYIFTQSINVKKKLLQSVIEKSGGLHEAKLDINVMRLMRTKLQRWQQLEDAIGSEMVEAFKETLLAPIRSMLPANAKLDAKESHSLLVMASGYGLGLLKYVAKYGVTARQKTSLRSVFWAVKETFDRCSKRKTEEKASAIQYLMSHDIFSKQIKVGNSDVDALVASVLYSKQGIQQGRTLVEGLRFATQKGQKYETFRGLIDRVRAHCNA